MNPSPLATPASHPDPATALNPVLQAALGSLDVQLDAELTRYRRSRYGRPSAQAQRVTVAPAKAKSRSLDLITVKPQSTEPGTMATPSPGQLESSEQTAPLTSAPAPTASAAIPPLFTQMSPTVAADPKAARMAQAAASEHHALAIATPATDEDDPQGYLASSAYLLQELADAEADRDRPEPPVGASFASQLLTPLGVGSLLLLLMSSIALGYVISNPAAIGHLNAWLGQSPAADTTSDPVTPADLNADILNDSANPNLATEEFIPLDLGTLSTLPGTGTPPTLAPSGANSAPSLAPNAATPNAAAGTAASGLNANPSTPGSVSPMPANPVAAAPRSEVTRPAPLPQTTTAAPPAPTQAPPTQAAAAAPRPNAAASDDYSSDSVDEAAIATPPAAAAPSPTADYFYVVTDYQGDPSLSSARTAVGDAYVRNFEDGARIQMGAFNDEAAAEDLLRNLESQGIDAEIKAPD